MPITFGIIFEQDTRRPFLIILKRIGDTTNKILNKATK